jgi:hypothetical protein
MDCQRAVFSLNSEFSVVSECKRERNLWIPRVAIPN